MRPIEPPRRCGVVLAGPYDLSIPSENEALKRALQQLHPIKCWTEVTDRGVMIVRTKKGFIDRDQVIKETWKSSRLNPPKKPLPFVPIRKTNGMKAVESIYFATQSALDKS